MADKTDIANRAGRKIGANPISDIADTTDKNALIWNSLFDDSLRVVLCEAYWMFATKRTELSLTSDAVDVSWTKNNLVYIYDLPDDFLRLMGWSEDNEFLRQEGQYLISTSNGGTTKTSVNEASVGDWSDDSVDYVVGDFVVSDESVYYCTVLNTSSSATEPGVGADWEDYWDLMREESTGVWTLVIEKRLGLIYQYYNTTIATYPPYFLEALVDRLVLDASYILAQNNTKTEYLEARYASTLSDAMAKNSQGQTPTSAKANAWLDAKYAGHNSWDNIGLYYR
jgi:hypothetical protein